MTVNTKCLLDVFLYHAEAGSTGHFIRQSFKEISSMISQIQKAWLKFYTPEGFPVLWFI